ncbi:selenoneine biosynthesis selenosugar synthase SenB [Massilia sp. YIM B02763]|uniref:selenoneine biosynthesis selenosugar synthase SenB n=1 Tax=Massilia sp. YIM B02763 TaxID=3050130 RepID=UPI0025B63EA1|nr:selenoneine biosynthesis selenosugar synthase SenB [Massilia sp. YIM B02763]MDN4055896.1 selenoneine biosynthesis selenosugar synthase SenB [Massilia sp. YIM B02763]
MARPSIFIASPASARENNGNWQTASRWRRFLQRDYRVAIGAGWQPGDAVPDLLVALHARRSAAALAAFKAAHPDRPALLVLTGTDLYRDIHADAAARASLALADAIVVLQPRGLDELDAAARAKAHVIYQSAPSLRPAVPRRGAALDVAMVGHLREEKDPLTFMRAAHRLAVPGLRLLHVGRALDESLDTAARETMAQVPAYRWLGALPHAPARRLLRRCHAMAIASRMEGGANVIIEAVTCGVPVLASDIPGNRGMLGEDYLGYFAPGDAAALAHLIERSSLDARFHARLVRQCAARARLFTPRREQARLVDLVDNLLLPRALHGGARNLTNESDA